MIKPRIGFIGTGIMGAPMSGHLANAGYPLTILDIEHTRAEAVASAHGNIAIADSPQDVAEVSEIVITMLPSGKYVHDVVLGNHGLVNGFKTGSILLDTTSAEPWITLEISEILAKKGIETVDAPVSGAEAGARAAKLVFMVGGKKEPVERIKPLLKIMGKEIFHLGPVGSGHIMKCINNTITAMTFLATAEGMILGKNSGLDPGVMTEVLNLSTGMSWVSQTHFKQRIINRKFDDPFKLELMLKDIGIAMELAREQAIPFDFSAYGFKLWQKADQFAGKGSSVSNLVRWIENSAGVDITPGSAKFD